MYIFQPIEPIQQQCCSNHTMMEVNSAIDFV